MIRVAAAILAPLLVLSPHAVSAVTLSLEGSPGAYTSHTLNSSYEVANPWKGFDLPLIDNLGGDGTLISVLKYGVKGVENGLSVSGPATATYMYLGSEAGFYNSLKSTDGGALLFQNHDPAYNVGYASGPFSLGAGLLPFMFVSNGGPSVANDGLASWEMNIGYFLLSKTSALVYLDDWGAGPDSDFDDLVFRVDVAPVPLPATLPLLFGGLGMLGVLGWRSKRTARGRGHGAVPSSTT